MNRLLFIALFLFAFNALFAQKSVDLDEMVVVFLQEEDTLFRNQVLPELTAFTNEKKMQLVVKNTENGIPESITTTPALIYQNFRGRSIYASRYMEFSTIKNFLRTSRVTSQKTVENCQKDILVWQNGKAKIAAPLKVTTVKGKLPKGFSQADFEEKVKAAFAQNMPLFDLQEEVCLQKTDRVFYLDIHPYLNENQELFLSLEIYSQFSCKDPVFSKMDTPLQGNLDNLGNLLSLTAAILEAEIQQQLAQSKIGDAYTAIPNNIKNATWEELNFALPAAPEKADFSQFATVEIPQNWTFHSAIDAETPIVQFKFMAPLDRYVGEIREISGDLQFIDNQNIMSGNFIANMQSLTMGMESFDYNVLNKYVKAYKIPTSSFEFEATENLSLLIFGESTNLTVNGTFELMKKKRPVEVIATLTPIIGEDGNPLLQVSASFSLNVVDDFKIKGPDGPSPARKMMLFDLNFLMKDSGSVVNLPSAVSSETK